MTSNAFLGKFRRCCLSVDASTLEQASGPNLGAQGCARDCHGRHRANAARLDKPRCSGTRTFGPDPERLLHKLRVSWSAPSMPLAKLTLYASS